MGTIQKCDICGKATKVYPKTRQVFNQERVMVPQQIEKDGEIVTELKEQTLNTPVMVKQTRQNPITQETEEVELPKIEDLEPRCYLVRISVLGQMYSADFCKECYEQNAKPVQEAIKFLLDTPPKDFD